MGFKKGHTINVGRKHSEESKKKISEGRKGIIFSDEHRIKISESNKKYYSNMSEEEKKILAEKMSQISDNKGKIHSEESKKNMKIGQRKYWDNLSREEFEERIKRFVNAPLSKTQDTKIEKEVERQLVNLGLKFIKQKYVHDGKRGYLLDFYIPKLKLVIECNGDYWHNTSKAKRRDKMLKEYVESTGRKIVFLWEHEIYENIDIVKMTMTKFMQK